MAHNSTVADVEYATTESLQQALRGHFDDALEAVSQINDDQGASDRVRLLRAQARVHTLRGYSQRAKSCLDEACGFAAQSILDEQQILHLNVHLLFVSAVGCGESNLDYTVLEGAAKELHQLSCLQDYTRDHVRDC